MYLGQISFSLFICRPINMDKHTNASTAMHTHFKYINIVIYVHLIHKRIATRKAMPFELIKLWLSIIVSV